jgi:hypothetical protein
MIHKLKKTDLIILIKTVLEKTAGGARAEKNKFQASVKKNNAVLIFTRILHNNK